MSLRKLMNDAAGGSSPSADDGVAAEGGGASPSSSPDDDRRRAATAEPGSASRRRRAPSSPSKNKAVPLHVAYSPLFRTLPEGKKYLDTKPYTVDELKLQRELAVEKKVIKDRLDPGRKKAVPESRPGRTHSQPSTTIGDNAQRETALTSFGPVPSGLALQVAAHRSYLRHRAEVAAFASSESRANIMRESAQRTNNSSVFKVAAERQKKRDQEQLALVRAQELFEEQLEQMRDDFSLSELGMRSAIELRERRTRKQLLENSWRGRQTIVFNASVTQISSGEQKIRCKIQTEHFLEREALERNCLQRVILNDRVQFLAQERVQRAAIMHLIAAQLAWRIRQEEELTRMISLERRSRQKVEDEEHFDFAPLETAKRALLEERQKQLKRDEELRQAKILEMEQHNRMLRADLERAESGGRQAIRSEDLDVRVQIRAQFVVAKRAVQDIEEQKRKLALEQWLETCARQQKPIIQKETELRKKISGEMQDIFNDIVGDFHQQWAELLVPVTANFGPTDLSCCRCGPAVNFASGVSFTKKPYVWYRDMYLTAVSIKVRFITNGRGARDLLSFAASQVAAAAPKKRGAAASMATNTPGLRLLIDGTILAEDGSTLCNAKFGDDADGDSSTGTASSTLDFEFTAPTEEGVVPLENVERILKNMTLAPDVQLLSPLARQLQFTSTMWFQRRITPGAPPLKGHQLQPGSKEAYSIGCVYSLSIIPPLIGCYGRAHTPQVTTIFDVRRRLGAGKGYSVPLLPDPQGLRSLNIDALTAGDDHPTTKPSSPLSTSAASASAAAKAAAAPSAMLQWANVKVRFVQGQVPNEDSCRWGGNADGFKFRKEDVSLDGVVIARPVKGDKTCLMNLDFALRHGEPFPLSYISRFLARLSYFNDCDQGPTSIATRTLEVCVAVKRVRDKDEDSSRNLDLVSFVNVELVFTANGKDDSMMNLDPGKGSHSALPSLIRVSREHASSAMRRYLNKVEERSGPLFPNATLELRGTNPTSVTLRASVGGGATFSLDLPKPEKNSGGKSSRNSKRVVEEEDDFDLGHHQDDDDDDLDMTFGGGGGGKKDSSSPKKKSGGAATPAGTLAIGAVPDDMKAPEDATGIFWCGIETDPNIPATRTCVGHICVDSGGKLEAFFKNDTKGVVISQFLRSLVVNVTETNFVMGASRAGTTSIASVQVTVAEQAPTTKRSAFSSFNPRDPEVALLQRVVLYVAPSISVTKGTISFPKEQDIPQILEGIVALPSAALASSACGSKLAGATLTVSIVDGRSGFEQLIVHPHDDADREGLHSSEVVTLQPKNGELEIKVGFKTVARVVQMETAGKPLVIQMVETDQYSDIQVPLLQAILARFAYMHSDADVLYEKVLMLNLTDVNGGACYAACQVQVVPSFEPTVMDDPPERAMVYRCARYPVYNEGWMPLFAASDLSDPDTELVGDAFLNVDPVSGTTEDDEIGFSEVPDPTGKHNITFDRLSIHSPLSILCNGREVAICRSQANEGRGNSLRVTFRPGIHLEVCGAVARTLCFRRMDDEVLRTIGDSTELKSYVFRYNAGDEEGVPDTRVPFEVRLRPPLLWRLLLHDAPLISAPRTVQPFRNVQTGAPATEVIANGILEIELIEGCIEGDEVEVGGSEGIMCVKDPQTEEDVVVVSLDVTRRLMTRVIGVTAGFSGIRVAQVVKERPDHMRIVFAPKCPLPAGLVSLILASVGFKIGECADERHCKLRAIFTHHVVVDEDFTSEESGWLESSVIVAPNDEPSEIHLKHNIVPCFASGSCFPFDGMGLTDPDTEFFDDEGVVSVVSGTSGVALSVLVPAGGNFVLEEKPGPIPGLTHIQQKGAQLFQIMLAKEKKPAAKLRVHEMARGAQKNMVHFYDYEHLPLPLVGKLMEFIAVKIGVDVRPAGHLLDVHLAANPRTIATSARVQLDVTLPCCTRVDPAPIMWLVANADTQVFPELINITIQSTSSLEVEFRFLDPETFWTSPLLRDAQFVLNPVAPLSYANSVVTVTTPGVSTPTIVCIVDAASAKQSLRMSFPRSSSRNAATLIEQVLRSVLVQVPEGGTTVPAGALSGHDMSVPGPIELVELRVVVSMTVPTASGPPASLALVKQLKRVVNPNQK